MAYSNPAAGNGTAEPGRGGIRVGALVTVIAGLNHLVQLPVLVQCQHITKGERRLNLQLKLTPLRQKSAGLIQQTKVRIQIPSDPIPHPIIGILRTAPEQ
jgi:hypothetical protein